MGLFHSRPNESASGIAPWLRTPLTDIGAGIGHFEGSCLVHQLRWVDCLEAYGPSRGRDKCKLLYQDFCECAGQWKQLQRVQDMREERNRQWVRGLIGTGPRVNLYAEPPPHDSYGPENLDDMSNNVK